MKKAKKKELFYCYYRNGDKKWRLYYESGQPAFGQVECYPHGAVASKGAKETAIVSMSKKPPKTLSGLVQPGITIHLRK